MTEKDIFSEDNEVKAEFWKLDKIGDNVKGVLVDKRIVTNTLKQPNCQQTIYTLIKEDGTPICIGGRGSQDPQTIAGLEQCKMGQLVGVKYVENRKSSTPGMNDAKIVRVFSNGKIEQKVLDKFRGVDTELDTSDLTDEM